MTKTQEYLEKLGACQEARDWVGNRTLQRAWEECDRLDWLHWLLSESILAEYKAKRAPIRAEYEAKYAPIRAEYEAKLAPILACRTCDEIRAKFQCPNVEG